jgi:AcrR family transcriptional regulator
MPIKKKQNIRETIINKSGQLFRKKGYRTTSIHQIAEAVGCTDAALYYHFKGGKAQILSEVINKTPILTTKFNDFVKDTKSLSELVNSLIKLSITVFPKQAEKWRWLLLEYSRLLTAEKRIVQAQFMSAAKEIHKELSRFITSDAEARKLSWLLCCLFFGMVELYDKIGFENVSSVSKKDFSEMVTGFVCNNYG